MKRIITTLLILLILSSYYISPSQTLNYDKLPRLYVGPSPFIENRIPILQHVNDNNDDGNEAMNSNSKNKMQTVLEVGSRIPMTPEQSHYLNKVLRIFKKKKKNKKNHDSIDDDDDAPKIRIFDGQNGEWLTKIVIQEEVDDDDIHIHNKKRSRTRSSSLKNKKLILFAECLEQLRPQQQTKNNENNDNNENQRSGEPWIFFAPLHNKKRLSMMIEKCTELGTYFFFDLRHTNNLQDVALVEVTKSLPLLVRTNIDSYHENKNRNKIESESENLNNESVYNKDDDLHQDTMKEDLVHHDETKREKSMSMNDSVSTKASHNNYDKDRNGHDVSMIQKYDYRKSFDAALRIKNNNKKIIKEIWSKQNIFPNKSHRVIKNQELIGDDSWKKLKQRQKQSLQGRNDQLKRNIETRKLNNDNVPTNMKRYENNLKSGKGSQRKSSEGIEIAYAVESFMIEKTTLSKTSCELTKAEVTPRCFNSYKYCSKLALDGYCTNSTFISNAYVSNAYGTYRDWMIENCKKSCNACLKSLLDSQIQYTEYDNKATTFNLSLDVTTNFYTSDTSWTFLSQNSEDSTIFDSSEVKTTSRLESNAEYRFNYYCIIPQTKENQQTDDEMSTCYNFEVHDSYGNGAGFFSLSLGSMNNKTLDVSREFEYGFVMSTSFCIDHDDGEIESEGKFIIYEDEVSEELNETTETNPYLTSCVATRAEIIFPCDDSRYYPCGFRASIGDCSKPDEKDWIDENCPKTCGACPPPVSLLENQIQHEEDENIVTTFNVSINVNTDGYARDTSWVLFPKDGENSTIFNSSDSIAISQLANNERHVIQYNCIISRNHESQIIDDTESICYDFEVHDLFGDGICCEYGDGSLTFNLNTNSSTLNIEDKFEDGYMMNVSFCINDNNGEIESVGKFSKTKKELRSSHYPFNWQCGNRICLCDSKPSLTTKIQENHIFLLEVSMLSGPDKLGDVESAQYKAACWVLYDDPYENYDLTDESNHNRMKQRYILAVLYFALSPEKWKEQSNFLSSRSECDWYYILCNKDDDVTSIRLTGNKLDGTIVYELDGTIVYELDGTIVYELDGTIVDELSGLRMLEYIYLPDNNIRGTIPSILGRLSELRGLKLGGNDLEGTIPPQLFNATNLEKLWLTDNRLEGTIPDAIGKLQKLSELDLKMNNLSGSIPDGTYTSKNLKWLYLDDNKLSSSISSLIGNLDKLEHLRLNNNMLTGQIPSTIGSLSSLRWLNLDNNRLSSSIPSTMRNMTSLQLLDLNNNKLSGPISESIFDLPYLGTLYLNNNSVTGSIPDEFCERSEVEVDCRNDVFDPKVSCSCCRCTDKSPIWDGDCVDSTIKVVIDHDYYFSTNKLEWSLANDATGKKVLHDGPYFLEIGLESHKACVAYSDCFSFNQTSPPRWETSYTIYWNDESIYNGTILGWYDYDYDGIKNDDPLQTLLSFSYDQENQRLASCDEIEFICGKEEQPIILKPNTTERIMYNYVTKISGKEIVNDLSSPQSKALCWILNNNHYDNKTHISETEIIQRYVLAILHVMSPDGLFGDDEQLAKKHECDWSGITCKGNNTQIVTEISLFSENNQIINGTLIDEIGSLKYLEVLELNQTKLHGTISRSFSNLWSLMKLDLSGNKISSTIPATLFHQLNNLDYIDLSDNKLTGSINSNIGSFSHIRFLSLNKNELTGSLPLESFNYYDLEHLDISENELSGIDFPLLLKHKNLKTLDVSRNFLVGSLLEHTFTSLSKLEYFNISQNDFSGTIPTTFPELSNITQLDVHSNRFKGPIPLGITELQNIQHLNLQGNKLTGSLSSEINQLQNLTTLVLSHNELKGSIPFNQDNLQKLERLHLQNNKLEGDAPQFSSINSYITDCGFPSDSLDKVSCSSCSTCCNSDGGCQSKRSEELSQVYKTLIFMFSIIGFTSMCYLMKDYITSNIFLKSFFLETVSFWNAMMLISDKSVYHFLLAKNKTEWFVAVCCVVFQTATLLLFVQSADMSSDTSDREYFMICPANSLDCENSNTVSHYGRFIFGIILTVWLLKDVIGSIKLMLVSFQKRSIDFFFASAMVFTVTTVSIWTSVIYIVAIAGKNTDMIKDAVVLLFVVEVDERIFQLVESINPDWIRTINNNMRQSLVYRGDDLVISSWVMKFVEILKSIRKKICERGELFRKRNIQGSSKSEVNKDKEEGEETHTDAVGVESNP